ncbi:EAL domain-containing protein [Massilia sp. CF038]|uniref:EAL domain-containing protein n=1 Tax=Massilia sp. CF038 TaxID=1881045 RepID=UPI00091BA8A2|nr:EAL domain-containing protein [Massilia sp. CF038]SHG72403.1 PAS domain S-box-containing protein/diguanylate cyclase (GGDEF) domain-containing protein [Massilia sp. CF038]
MSDRGMARVAPKRDPAWSTMDMLNDQIAVIDATGTIISVNAAWEKFARDNGGDARRVCAGANYLSVCEHAAQQGDADALRALRALREVLAGESQSATMEYACDAPHEERWFRLRFMRSPMAGQARFVAVHEQVVAPLIAERQIRLQRHLLASVEQAVIATNLSGVIVFWNPFAEKMYGWSAAEVLGRNIVEVLPAESARQHTSQIMARLNRGESWIGEYEVRHRNGRTMQVHVTDSPLRNERNQMIGVIGVSTDITEKKRIEKALRLSGMVYKAIGEAIMVFDMQGRVEAINPAFTALTGYAEADIVGRNVDLLKCDAAAGLVPFEGQPVLSKTGHWAGSVRARRKSGEQVLEWLRIDTIYDESGCEKLRIGMFSPVTDQKRAKETIWRQANFDTLTGLPNRSMFRDRLEHESHKAARSGARLALMFIDLDQFKEVNDTLGHDTGDILLQQAAERLSACVRAVDTVARIGGDEFTVILGELDGATIVERVASQIVRAMAQPFYLGENSVYVSASIGITVFPDDARDVDSLIRNADQAMYAAKNQGRDQFRYFTQRMQHEALMRMRLSNDLRHALSNQEFELLYQPIVGLATGAIHKAEALLRWRHPVRGNVSPVEFIPVAEQTGMIVPIGDWVFQRATEQAAVWRERIDPQFQISVNLSPAQLRHVGNGGHRLPAWQPPVSAGASACAILEITENILLESNKAIMAQLQSMREAGVQLAIDDFGTGYSALSYLRKFHIDYLKIDRSFVTRLAANSDDLSMCEAIIAMAHKLDIKVIAEGIERAEQRDLLTQAGCDYGQGFLFAGPLPAASLCGMLGR